MSLSYNDDSEFVYSDCDAATHLIGKKDKKDKENTINTTHPQKMQTERPAKKENFLMCFYTNADQLRTKLSVFERRIE